VLMTGVPLEGVGTKRTREACACTFSTRRAAPAHGVRAREDAGGARSDTRVGARARVATRVSAGVGVTAGAMAA
jgi:hypothetical protein